MLILLDRVKCTENERQIFANLLIDISRKLRLDPNHLMMIMWFESQLDPRARNKYGSASGLIQFTARTAKLLGTSIYEIRQMNAIQQLKYVYRYLKPFKGKLHNFIEIYLAIFYPRAVGKPLKYKLPLTARWVRANRIFDVDRDGVIHKWEIKYKMEKWFHGQGIEYDIPTF